MFSSSVFWSRSKPAKRAYLLYLEQGLQVRTKKRRKLPRRDRIEPAVPKRSMLRWSLDFTSDRLVDYRRFRNLNNEPLLAIGSITMEE